MAAASRGGRGGAPVTHSGDPLVTHSGDPPATHGRTSDPQEDDALVLQLAQAHAAHLLVGHCAVRQVLVDLPGRVRHDHAELAQHLRARARAAAVRAAQGAVCAPLACGRLGQDGMCSSAERGRLTLEEAVLSAARRCSGQPCRRASARQGTVPQAVRRRAAMRACQSKERMSHLIHCGSGSACARRALAPLASGPPMALRFGGEQR